MVKPLPIFILSEIPLLMFLILSADKTH